MEKDYYFFFAIGEKKIITARLLASTRIRGNEFQYAAK